MTFHRLSYAHEIRLIIGTKDNYIIIRVLCVQLRVLRGNYRMNDIQVSILE